MEIVLPGIVFGGPRTGFLVNTRTYTLLGAFVRGV